ncbi:hypothetical protein L6164_016635 [Bauhinia variegata]|uniref:Uncharacterized protein n=1 Tax=Bauhinia variegata TaxID=167791 RepID=A0ACB9NNZ1_BAUVA|nr:hypothetical protein L6164_016635 [Bauhinia variegata]
MALSSLATHRLRLFQYLLLFSLTNRIYIFHIISRTPRYLILCHHSGGDTALFILGWLVEARRLKSTVSEASGYRFDQFESEEILGFCF